MPPAPFQNLSLSSRPFPSPIVLLSLPPRPFYFIPSRPITTLSFLRFPSASLSVPFCSLLSPPALLYAPPSPPSLFPESVFLPCLFHLACLSFSFLLASLLLPLPFYSPSLPSPPFHSFASPLLFSCLLFSFILFSCLFLPVLLLSCPLFSSPTRCLQVTSLKYGCHEGHPYTKKVTIPTPHYPHPIQSSPGQCSY